MKVPDLYVLVGLPGSGKSTWARSYSEKTGAVILSSDTIRHELFNDENYQGDNGQVFDVMNRRVIDNLARGHTVIYDATNINSKRRKALLDMISSRVDCRKHAEVFAVPFTECLWNNWHRERVVPYEAMCRMYKFWQTPYWFEGWDGIGFARGGDPKLQYDASMYMGYNQNNPHHTHTLGEHMWNVYKALKDNKTDNIELLQAAKMHDIGKPFTRTTDEDGVSHYYGHENVGAYDAISMYGQTLLTSVIINYHMCPLHWKSADNLEAVRQKYRKLWGDELYDCVRLLHERDIIDGK